MDQTLAVYNTHQTNGLEYFLAHDPQLRRLSQLPLPYTATLLNQLPDKEPGVYTLGGGRQVGKSTLLKQWMANLMQEKNIPPKAIFYFSGDMIDDHHQLLTILSDALKTTSAYSLCFIVLDEVTEIKNWDKAIKFLADSAQLDHVIVMLSGSDLMMLEAARMRFPGRRGKADCVDFHLYPLSFYEYLTLTEKTIAPKIFTDESWSETEWFVLYKAFDRYLQHGGYLTAINDFAKLGRILPATFTTYSDWIRGDMLKQGKQTHYLQELLGGVFKHYMSQISWQTLAKSLSIDHHKTISDYVDLLSRMDAVYVQYALLEDKLTAAPKKARKVFFTDPFIYHAIGFWLNKDTSLSLETSAALVETCVVTHFRRHYPTFYIKAEGEVDVAYIHEKKFWPIELKWRNTIHSKDLKQILKYNDAEIWIKEHTHTALHGIPAQALPLALAKLG